MYYINPTTQFTVTIRELGKKSNCQCQRKIKKKIEEEEEERF